MLTLNKLLVQDTNYKKKLSITFLPFSVTCLKGDNNIISVLLKKISGIYKTSSKEIALTNLQLSYTEIKRPFALYISDYTALQDEYTVMDNMLFWAKCYNSSAAINIAIEYFQLSDELLYQKCALLSPKVKQFIALSRLIICKSKIWLIDHLDMVNSNQQLINTCNKLIASKADSGGIVLMSANNHLFNKYAQFISI